MRPTRLELTGFGSFREPTTIDFTDADLFVLVGPTGAGKSTVIDALIFALYGSVPRYDDRRLVAPVINQGRVEAKVRLDFLVGGAGYSAVRIVRRTAVGATTKEARLERWDVASGPDGGTTTLAGNEKELTERVESLLGLSFDHFTRCVVLPQGAFARFLNARAAERQNLLVDLLGIEVYRRIARRAREQAKQASTRVEQTRQRLDGELADATPAALAAAARRVDVLRRLDERIADAQPELERLREQGVELRAAANVARERRSLLDDLAQPPGVAALSRRLREAAGAEADALAAVEKAEQQRQAVEAARAQLPDGTVVAELRRLVTERDRKAQARAPATAALAAADAAHRTARDDHHRAHQAVQQAREHRDRLREANLALALARRLHVGDDCPVCARPIERPPHPGDAGDLDAADATHRHAEEQLARAAEHLRVTTAERARRQQAHDDIVTTYDDLRTRVDAVAAEHSLDVASLPRLADAVAQSERDVAAARDDEQTARATARTAAKAVKELGGEVQAAWKVFDATRDRLAVLGPPAVDRVDPAAAWSRLLDWAQARTPALDRAAKDAARAVEEVAARWRQRNSALLAACAEAGVAVNGTDPRSACAAALERARGEHVRIARAIETTERLRRQIRADEHLAEALTALGHHLGAKRFEQWLLTQALMQLVADASVRLRELSSQAYSLQVDDGGGFLVVDHRNADELRSARTLSGGETFLASLSLALSLADHVAQLAAGTTANLDALFLDEGFGTLDHDTLDVVAAALEELGSQGRTVGLVTHVRELAERMPTRYEVRRTGETSIVDRVEA